MDQNRKTDYKLYAIVGSRMKFISDFIVVDWSIYDYDICSSEISIRVLLIIFLFLVPKIMFCRNSLTLLTIVNMYFISLFQKNNASSYLLPDGSSGASVSGVPGASVPGAGS